MIPSCNRMCINAVCRRISLILLVVLVAVEHGLCAASMCDCGLYIPSGRMVTRVSTVATGCGAATGRCTCEVKANSCLRRCVEDLNRSRLVGTYRSWQRTACTRHARNQPAPGVSMLAGVELRHDPNCSIRPVFQELLSKPLCCRGTTTFDTACDW